jgi:hypothetical protein
MFMRFHQPYSANGVGTKRSLFAIPRAAEPSIAINLQGIVVYFYYTAAPWLASVLPHCRHATLLHSASLDIVDPFSM